MTHPEDRPGTAEKYTRALSTHHLEVVADERGDVDLLIAAGWTKAGLGTDLYRLRAEFDTVWAAHEQAERNLRATEDMVRILRRARPVPAQASPRERQAHADHMAKLERVAAELTKDGQAQARTALALILVQMKTLPEARASLGRYAVRMATFRGLMRNDVAVLQIAGRALQNWLSPLCRTCHGVGAFGQVGGLRSLCNDCGGSGHHRVPMAPDAAGQDFGHALLVQMDRKTESVARLMRRFLARGEGKGQPDEGQVEDMRLRIVGMRRTEAERD